MSGTLDLPSPAHWCHTRLQKETPLGVPLSALPDCLRELNALIGRTESYACIYKCPGAYSPLYTNTVADMVPAMIHLVRPFKHN